MRASDEVFAVAWSEAIDTGTDVLEDEAFRRAYDGVVEPIVSGGRQVMDPDGKPMAVRRYSDSLMVTLLKARRPEKFKDRSVVDAKVAVTANPAAGFADLLKTLSQDERDFLRSIAERQVARIEAAEEPGV